ncbi:hypothetical protein EDC01DRAFT_704813 [Geopyxis carbonaria]|nr:hypothetical protein EDC01DRAFT_704813 [Geopyxis carbonaria]
MPPRIPPFSRAPRWCRRLPAPARRLQSILSGEPHIPTAPKATINLKSIRADPAYHSQNCINRNYPALSSVPQRIVALHNELVQMQQSLRSERERANTVSYQIRGAAKDEKAALLAEAKELKTKISAVEAQESELEKEMKALGESLPNRTHPATPVGTEPKLLRYLNEHLAPSATAAGAAGKSHIQIGAELKLLDFSDAGTVSGWGWYYLLNEAVLLEQALISYALSLARRAGFAPVAPPSIVHTHIATACGFRPRDASGELQTYTLAPDGRHSLAATAEVPLAGMHANKTLPAASLPLRYAGVGRAFRAEAGARGADAKGLYRVHEFTKVELFAWAAPPAAAEAGSHTDESSASTFPTAANAAGAPDAVFDAMLALQVELLTSLGLYCRVLEMPTSDLGASAARKVDIEAYMPSRAGRDPWGEVSSLSLCTDYQSRRLNTRMKGGAKTAWPWTLNGTAVAVPRVLIAVLESGWDEQVRGVRVPEVLRPFLGGLEVIRRREGEVEAGGRREDC